MIARLGTSSAMTCHGILEHWTTRRDQSQLESRDLHPLVKAHEITQR
jgi:hypothetical protein